jgi:hypothetical protein
VTSAEELCLFLLYDLVRKLASQGIDFDVDSEELAFSAPSTGVLARFAL